MATVTVIMAMAIMPEAIMGAAAATPTTAVEMMVVGMAIMVEVAIVEQVPLVVAVAGTAEVGAQVEVALGVAAAALVVAGATASELKRIQPDDQTRNRPSRLVLARAQ